MEAIAAELPQRRDKELVGPIVLTQVDLRKATSESQEANGRFKIRRI